MVKGWGCGSVGEGTWVPSQHHTNKKPRTVARVEEGGGGVWEMFSHCVWLIAVSEIAAILIEGMHGSFSFIYW
jgi:hypothetical protein